MNHIFIFCSNAHNNKNASIAISCCTCKGCYILVSFLWIWNNNIYKIDAQKIGRRSLVSIICCKFALNNWFYDVFHPQLFDVVSSLRSNILALNHQVLLMIVLILCSIYFSLDNWQHEKWFLRFSMSRKTYKHSWKS